MSLLFSAPSPPPGTCSSSSPGTWCFWCSVAPAGSSVTSFYAPTLTSGNPQGTPGCERLAVGPAPLGASALWLICRRAALTGLIGGSRESDAFQATGGRWLPRKLSGSGICSWILASRSTGALAQGLIKGPGPSSWSHQERTGPFSTAASASPKRR